MTSCADNFSEEELAEARTQLCFNICSHYDCKLTIKDFEEVVIKMTIEDPNSYVVQQVSKIFSE